MWISRMRNDQLRNFSKCIVPNSDGTCSVKLEAGSSSGNNYNSNRVSDTMKAFDGTINKSTHAVRGF